MGNYERISAMEPRLQLKRVPPQVMQVDLEHETARSAGLRLTYWANGAPSSIYRESPVHLKTTKKELISSFMLWNCMDSLFLDFKDI